MAFTCIKIHESLKKKKTQVLVKYWLAGWGVLPHESNMIADTEAGVEEE